MDDDRDSLQRLVDKLFPEPGGSVTRLDVTLWADILDLPDILETVILALPPVHYTRQRLCDQLNSALVGHGLSRIIATVD